MSDIDSTLIYKTTISGIVAAGSCYLPQILDSEKNTNFGAGSLHILGELEGKIEILSIHISSVGKLQLLAPTLLTDDAAVCKSSLLRRHSSHFFTFCYTELECVTP